MDPSQDEAAGPLQRKKPGGLVVGFRTDFSISIDFFQGFVLGWPLVICLNFSSPASLLGLVDSWPFLILILVVLSALHSVCFSLWL